MHVQHKAVIQQLAGQLALLTMESENNHHAEDDISVSRQDPGRTVPRNFSYQDLGNISGGSSGAEEKGGTGDWGFGYDYESEASGKLSGASLLCDSL